MPSSSGQRLRREQGMRCRTSFPLCALVRVFCVRPYSTAALRHGVCETCATFWSTKRHPRPLNGSFFPLRGLTRRAFLLQKGGGGAQKKGDFFAIFHCCSYLRCTYWEHDCSPARARPALGACATHPGHTVNMLAEERRCKRHPGAASFHAAPRLCAPLPAALPQPEPQRTELSNLACRLRPASRTVAG